MSESRVLTRAQTRRFVVAFLLALVGLAVYATVAILHGQADPALQEQVETIEARRQSELPRLDARPDDGVPASVPAAETPGRVE